ncbi:FAD-binding monooxygenase [Roseateles sp.]|uniref:FAD-binding monooxygenase n=1 Tax=Roseateles sp. TaxID=1971397 RepID=UPI003265C774
MADSLPADIIQAIAISNAKSIGEQPAVLANLALAQQIFNQNMQQQIALSQQQAMNQVHMATAARAVTLIEHAGQAQAQAHAQQAARGGCMNQDAIDQMAQDVGRILAQIQTLHVNPPPPPNAPFAQNAPFTPNGG